ncbi:MAG: CDP-diacylglycerol--serine O-phosphatidyltransferase [Bacteroidales bacterium]|nr:CDP-diacylglycerol--serine O-phosphatidyltransferase [Bacteroidales bacterium]
MKRHIPNLLTELNLFCGCIAIVLALKDNNLEYAAYFIFIAAFFDLIDGMAARLLNVKSELGKQLDSLSDVVSFGVAPAAIVFQMLNQNVITDFNPYLPYLAFLIAVFSALRLGKFNIDTRQTSSFIGLPTPANAMFFASLALLNTKYPILISPLLLLFLTFLFSWLLVSPLKLFSLKFNSLSWSGNEVKYIFLAGTLILLITIKLYSLPLIILYYILLSLFSTIFKFKQ